MAEGLIVQIRSLPPLGLVRAQLAEWTLPIVIHSFSFNNCAVVQLLAVCQRSSPDLVHRFAAFVKFQALAEGGQVSICLVPPQRRLLPAPSIDKIARPRVTSRHRVALVLVEV